MSAPPLPPGSKPIDLVPLKYGVIVFPGFQALDAFGPLDALNSLASTTAYPLELCILAETLDPVSTKAPDILNIQHGSNFAQSIVPTHTFESAPPIDVLIVPGGIGVRPPANTDAVIKYIGDVYPTLQYLITVCTGSGLVARASILDGRKATTNKMRFEATSALRPQVNWVPHARWVVDGNVWTASGVSAGIDVIFAFIAHAYGDVIATDISNHLEYERHTDPNWDPFAQLYGLA